MRKVLPIAYIVDPLFVFRADELLAFQMNIAQSEIDIFQSNVRSEQNKLKDTIYNLETAEKTFKDRNL